MDGWKLIHFLLGWVRPIFQVQTAVRFSQKLGELSFDFRRCFFSQIRLHSFLKKIYDHSAPEIGNLCVYIYIYLFIYLIICIYYTYIYLYICFFPIKSGLFNINISGSLSETVVFSPKKILYHFTFGWIQMFYQRAVSRFTKTGVIIWHRAPNNAFKILREILQNDHRFVLFDSPLEPETSVYKWLFRLDDSKSLHKKYLFHHFHPFKTGCLGYQAPKWII